MNHPVHYILQWTKHLLITYSLLFFTYKEIEALNETARNVIMAEVDRFAVLLDQFQL